MTLLDLVAELNNLVEKDIVAAQTEIDIYNTRIALADDDVITFEDEEEDDYCDDVDETGFNPYIGGYDFDC